MSQKITPKIVAAVVVCGEREARCVCGEPVNHEGPHECNDKTSCNGAWNYGENGFEIVRFPWLDAPKSDFMFGVSE